ncbi:hypothetical protein [Nonomuraea wenchangensis]|uniref:Uncharacterized protein n=1 Tax=Nonomuraea wenchangensis TaxID=568860 RepID=A0A1I0F399_9ACTN|nr:hypothetical protein [Nonomuraea wenchangensis]SET51499.1 hypothetical protein SAMN05421811_103280 [Nonomuraea wenchangensis]
MGALDKLETLAVFFNDAANGTLLLVIALLALVLAAVGVVWLRDRLNRLPARRPNAGLDVLDPAADTRELAPPLRVEHVVRDALGDEADRLTAEWDRQWGRDR